MLHNCNKKNPQEIRYDTTMYYRELLMFISIFIKPESIMFDYTN